MKRQTGNYMTVTLSAIIMVLTVYTGSSWLKRVKVDVTEEKLYTISDGSKSVLKKLNTPLTLKLYYSKTAANKGTEGLRTFNNYFFYVRDLLEEYVAHSRNNLKLQVIDPRPDTKEEEDATTFGLKKFQLTETEKYFFGLVIENNVGTEKVIEFFDPGQQENLEYEVTRLIYSVINPRKKKVGILSSLPILNDKLTPYMAQLMKMQGKRPQESWIITKLIREFYDVQKVKKDVEKISGLDILLIAHPKNLPEKTLWAIDQYVLNGGKVLLFVDPYSIVDNVLSKGRPGAEKKSNLKKLMAKWGVELEEGKLAGDRFLSGIGRMNARMQPQRLLPLLECDQRCSNEFKDAISYKLGSMTFLYPGSLIVLDKEQKDKKIYPLLSTTEKGNAYKFSTWKLSDPTFLWKDFKEGTKPIHLAYKIVGKFETAFPEGIKVKKKDKKGKSEKEVLLTGLKKSSKESAIIVFSDIDFIHDQFSFKTTVFGVGLSNDNSTLVLNSLEQLSGSKELMEVRSKGRFNRTFDVVDKIEFESEAKTAKKVVEIKKSIEGFEKELGRLGRLVNETNIGLIQNEGIQKKRELTKRIAQMKGELRDVKRKGRERIEKLGVNLQYLNTLFMPSLLFIFGIFFHFKRKKGVKKNLKGE
jgi:ABC-type uncharacterized transport system involved in gliding motility auxiliary subunit